MKTSKLFWIILFLPLIIALFMWKYLQFGINTKDTLALFLSLIWGVFVSLGGSFIFISRIDFSKQKKYRDSVKNISQKIQGISIILLFHSLVFIFLSLIYPLKNKIVTSFNLSNETVDSLSSLYDSLLYMEIFTPGFFAVLIGVWSIMLTINTEHEST